MQTQKDRQDDRRVPQRDTLTHTHSLSPLFFFLFTPLIAARCLSSSVLSL